MSYGVHGTERIDLADLLRAFEATRDGWRWRDWLEEMVAENIRRTRQEAA